MILSPTHPPPPNADGKLKIDPENLEREVQGSNILSIYLSINTSLYQYIYLSINASNISILSSYLHGGCLDEAETGLKGIDSPATFGWDGAMNIAPPPLTD